MKRLLPLSLMCAVVSVAVALESSPPSDPAKLLAGSKRILFLGDSITWAGGYVVDFECWLLTSGKRGAKSEVLDLGLSSETVSGLSEPNHAGGKFPRPDLRERLGRVLSATKPDLVIACYGMNDGIYLPFDEGRFQKFQEGMRNLHEMVKASGASIIHATPPVYDPVPVAGKFNYYAGVLGRYSAWLLEQRKSGWLVADINGPMAVALTKQRIRTSNKSFSFSNDGVHPNEEGHRVMAGALVGYFAGSQGVAGMDRLLDSEQGKKLRPLVAKRMGILRDAWLASTGHKRPGLPKGLPLDQAEKQADAVGKEIEAVLGKQ